MIIITPERAMTKKSSRSENAFLIINLDLRDM
jgi:hypothetical protein